MHWDSYAFFIKSVHFMGMLHIFRNDTTFLLLEFIIQYYELKVHKKNLKNRNNEKKIQLKMKM